MKKIGFAFAMLALASATPAQASTADWGTPNSVYGFWNGAVLFHTTGARSATPSCQGPGLASRFAIDASTTAGQAAVSILLTAIARGKRVQIHGSGSCTIWGDTETISYILVED